MTREEGICNFLMDTLEELRTIRADIANGTVEIQCDQDKAENESAMMVQYTENVLTDVFGGTA